MGIADLFYPKRQPLPRLPKPAPAKRQAKAIGARTVILSGGYAYPTDRAETYLKSGFELNADIYSVISLLTRAAAAVPPMVYEVKDDKAFRQFKKLKTADNERAGFLKTKSLEEVPESDPLYKLIERPNPNQAWPEFIENAWGFFEAVGNAYIHGVQGSDGRILEMWNLPAHLTAIKSSNSIEAVAEGYQVQGYGKVIDITDPSTVLHLKYWNPNYNNPGSHLYGMSPLKAGLAMVKASNEAAKALENTYKNNGAAGMAFPDDPDIEDLSEEQRQALQEELQSRAGSDNAKSILVTSVKMGWTPFGISPVDLELLSSMNMSMRKICNLYGVSSELLNDPENKTQANKKEARKGLYLDNIVPKLERVYRELNRFLVPKFSRATGKKYYIDYDLSAIPAMSDDIGQVVSWLKQADWLTKNEKRERIDYGSLEYPYLDEIWVSPAEMPLSEATGMPPTEDYEL